MEGSVNEYGADVSVMENSMSIGTAMEWLLNLTRSLLSQRRKSTKPETSRAQSKSPSEQPLLALVKCSRNAKDN